MSNYKIACYKELPAFTQIFWFSAIQANMNVPVMNYIYQQWWSAAILWLLKMILTYLWRFLVSGSSQLWCLKKCNTKRVTRYLRKLITNFGKLIILTHMQHQGGKPSMDAPPPSPPPPRKKMMAPSAKLTILISWIPFCIPLIL